MKKVRSLDSQTQLSGDYLSFQEVVDEKNIHFLLLETFDGLYTPIGLCLPNGQGPFPLVLLSSGNGGEGLAWVRDNIRDNAYTFERMVQKGYACAWIRYRTEVELGYNNGGKLIRDKRQGREMFNRSPLEYEDEIAIIEMLKSFEEIDEEKVALVGMSHAGEMILKITSEYDGVVAAVASEPAAHEFLCLTPDSSAFINSETNLRNIESMQMQQVEKVLSRIDIATAKARIDSINTPLFIMGRDRDELQGIFKVTFDLLCEAKKTVEWKSYQHDIHGFIFPQKKADGKYLPDEVQLEAINDILSFIDKYMN